MMSNPLKKGDNSPDIEFDPSGELPDGIDLGSIDDLDVYIKGLVDLENQERRYSKSIVPKLPVDKVDQARKELFNKGSKFSPVKREDIAGIDNILLQIDEIVDWLVHYETYVKFHSRPEPGIIFEGSPGTGKTYTSRYMATVSNALFIDVRDFPYAGGIVGARDIKDLFQYARATHARLNRPVVLFWDEFEGVAIERSRNVTPEQKAAISQITAELDGINGKSEGLLLIGCTNYGGEIDQALRRPGRMGVHIQFNAPDRVGKSKLLKFYLSKIKTKGDIDLDTASYFFEDSDTAATVEEAVQDAWRFAIYRWIRADKPKAGPTLTQDDLIEIFLKRLIGPPPAYSDVTPQTLLQVAIHEVGHAIVAHILGVGLRLITVRPGKEHLGKTMTYMQDPRTSTLDELQDHLKVGVAGFVVEELAGIPRGADSAGDTQGVTELALDMVDNQGFGAKTGLMNVRMLSKRFYNANVASDSILQDSDGDAAQLINDAEKEARKILTDFGVENIRKLAERLIEVQTMTGKDFAGEVKKIGTR